MSETTTETTTEAPATGAEGELGDAGKQALDRMKAERNAARAEAKVNADAAKKLEAIEAANKTDAEKVADRLAAADAEVATVPAKVAEALKAHLVDLHSINDEDAELFLNASDPQTLLKQVGRLMEREATSTAEKKKHGNYVPREGATSTAPENDERTIVRSLFGGGD